MARTRAEVLPEHGPEALADELALVARVRAGDQAALGEIFRAYYRELCAYADRYLTSPADAEDLVADIFVRIWALRAEWEVSRGVRHYLFGAVRNRAFNAVRDARGRARRLERVARDLTVAGGGAFDPDSEAPQMDAVGTVRRAIARLSPERQRVLWMRWHEGLSYAEIAREVGSSVRAVEVQLARTLKALRASCRTFLK